MEGKPNWCFVEGMLEERPFYLCLMNGRGTRVSHTLISVMHLPHSVCLCDHFESLPFVITYFTFCFSFEGI